MADIALKEKYQVLPSMPPEQFEALKADIEERGVLVPIDVDEDGDILDGHHRYRACVELGITDFPTIVRPGLSEEDRRIFARKSNMLRRHLSRKQVRHLIAEQLKDTPSWANNRIAQVLGVDSKTVKVERERLEGTSEIPKLDKLVGADGKERPVKQKRPPAVMATDADELHRILKLMEQGLDVEQIQGFLSEQSLYTIISPDYSPFAHCDEDGERQWHLFMLFGVKQLEADLDDFSRHVEWILQREFKTPSEWLGEEGINWRKTQPMGEMHPSILKRWEKFLAKHDGKSVADITALLDQIAAKAPNSWR